MSEEPQEARTAVSGQAAPAASWNLRLYIAGQTPKSLQALANLIQLCEAHLAGKFRIEIIDLLENPHLASGDQIVAAPTLIRRLPPSECWSALICPQARKILQVERPSLGARVPVRK